MASSIARPALTALVIWLCVASAQAHLTPNSVVSLDFGSRSIAAEVLIPATELGVAARVSPVIAKSRAFVSHYVQQHLAVRAPDGRPWTARLRAVTIVTDAYNTDVRTTLELTPPPGAPLRRFSLRYDGVIDRVPNHFVLVFARSDFAAGTLSSEPELIGGLQGPVTTLAINRGEGSGWRGFAAALHLGMNHIAEGHDHLLFLIALILPAPLIAGKGRWGAFGGWRYTVRRLVAVVTAFTIGHSLTLIGGAFFGWQLSARPIEVGIALSIFVSAIHAWRPIFGGREAFLAAGFGLVHGLAFATVIGNFGLEPLQKAQSILGFNLGIELVQLAVVIAILPALLLLARRPGYRFIRSAGAAFAGGAALIWVEERVSGSPNGFGGAVDLTLGYAPWLILAATAAAVALHFAEGNWRARNDSNVRPSDS